MPILQIRDPIPQIMLCFDVDYFVILRIEGCLNCTLRTVLLVSLGDHREDPEAGVSLRQAEAVIGKG